MSLFGGKGKLVQTQENCVFEEFRLFVMDNCVTFYFFHHSAKCEQNNFCRRSFFHVFYLVPQVEVQNLQGVDAFC